MEIATTYHIPVLADACVDGLNIQPNGIYVDATFGGGGHSAKILEKLGENGRLYGFDQDEEAEKNVLIDSRFTFVRSNFRYLSNFMTWYGVKSMDGLLADLGVSSHHLDDATRGFSFRFNSPLDMRMNKRAGKSAAEILNTFSEKTLADIFYFYGELKNAKAIARAVVKSREIRPVSTTADFLELLKPIFGREKEKKYLALVFQSLRIFINCEMEALKEMLMQACTLLKPGGRLAVIAYHSLEDRLVKNFFKTGNFEGNLEKDFYGNPITPFLSVNNKVIVPEPDEMEKNPRARSAKLRIAEKKNERIE